jgi:hypothetical protein
MPGSILYYSDEHVSKAVIKGLRQRGIDILSCQEANMLHASDEEHLALAARLGRVVITQDTDFIRLHHAGIEHSGVVYAHQQLPISKVITGLLLIWEVLEPDEMVNYIEYI